MEDKSDRAFGIEPRVLILFLILGIPTVLVGDLLLLSGAENRFREVVGAYFGNEADRLQGELINYIEDVVVQVGNLTSVDEIQAIVDSGNSRPPKESQFAQEVQRIEKEWPDLSTENSKLLSRILENDASLFLRDYNRVAATYREILVTDRFGRLVGASGKCSDYFQADEAWWRVAYLEGKGQRFISDVQYDESARAYCIEVAEPIRSVETGDVIGIIKAIVDSEEMFAILKNVAPSEKTSGILARMDGSIVTDPEATESYPFLNDAVAAMALNRRAIRVPESEPRAFLGLPEFGVKEKIPELDWLVIIQSPYDDVFAPFGNLRSWFTYISLCSIALVVVLSLVFTWLLSKPIIETDPHLEKV